MGKLRVLLADDHTLLREGLAALINSEPDMKVVVVASSGRQACARAKALKPDVAVIDLSMPEMNGFEVALALQRDCPKTKVIALTMHEDENYVREAIQLKVAGYLLKRSPLKELLQAIRNVARGGTHFDSVLTSETPGDELERLSKRPRRNVRPTAREERVLRLIALGYTNK